MNKSFKTTTLIAAIGMIAFTIYLVTLHVIRESCPMSYQYDLWNDIMHRLVHDMLSLSLIIAGIGLLKYRPSTAASKSFRILTVCLFIALVGTLIFSPLYAGQLYGMAYLFPPFFWRITILVAGIVWLFMLMRQPVEEASPRSYQVTIFLAMIVLAFPMLLEALSGITYFFTGNILSLRSICIKSWTSWIASTLVLVHFVFPQIKAINTMRNSHCTPGSFDERTFKHNRTISLVLVGLSLIAFAVCYFSDDILQGSYFFHYYFLHDMEWEFMDAYYMFESIAKISAVTLLVFLLFSWIMLSIMAFRQLPNPLGYKIYNIICQILFCGCILLAVITSEDDFWLLSLYPFCAFFITTAIRVISYSLPK